MVNSHNSLGLKVFYFSPVEIPVEGADGAPSPFIDRSPAPLNMALGVAFVLSLILVIGHHQEGPGSLAKTFTFPEYPYKETTKNVSRPYNSLDLSLMSGTCLKADTGYGEQPSFGRVALYDTGEGSIDANPAPTFQRRIYVYKDFKSFLYVNY